MNYTEQNVYEAAMDRIRAIFDSHDDIIISMSGGKDSTVTFEMAYEVAKEKNRLPIKAYWLDQEVEWQHTVDYMDKLMRRPGVIPYWFQCPFDFTNALSPQKNFIHLWDPEEKDKWVHPQSDISIKENPTKYKRFHQLIGALYKYMDTEDKHDVAVLCGMRIAESPARRVSIVGGNARWHGETWCTARSGNVQRFFPIYDFTDDDIWTAIAKNHWEYNKVYDLEYRWGVPKHRMRVSALIHEKAYGSIAMLHEFEPKTYNRMCARVPGTSTYSHGFEAGGGTQITPSKLPFAFKDWKEYRDYLLVHLVKPEYWDLFRKRWKGQDSDDWYQIHVWEVCINDIDGTTNQNAIQSERLRARSAQAKERDRKMIEEREAEKEAQPA